LQEVIREPRSRNLFSNLNTPQLSWDPNIDLLCFSHLRWDFVFQRPQHLLTRAAKERRVFYFEEPLFDVTEPQLSLDLRSEHLVIVAPHVPAGLSQPQTEAAQSTLLQNLVRSMNIERFVLWCYTPMAIGIWRELEPLVTVYDCMDELSLFQGASPLLKARERELLARADLVFTGGRSLYEAKREQHERVFAFPSSIDAAHFAQARGTLGEPEDQRTIPHPRIGFFGVLDERLDIDLLRSIADSRPDWQFVLLGPVAKIDPAVLPAAPNIHYLGGKKYEELPAYIAHWEVATLLFARNDATRFISPTKTPEYLAAGRPVVSTSIRDVVRPYGDLQLVSIADEPAAFVAAIGRALESQDPAWLIRVDRLLSNQSWDATWKGMAEIINGVIASRDQVLQSAAD
jgi:glycosyltransferase involved in cell wall biosynthesis